FTRVGNYDLLISIDNGVHTGEIVLQDQFKYSTSFVELIDFNGSSTLDLTTQNWTLNGTAGNDLLYGVQFGGGNIDTIYGGDGRDQIYGRAGNDTLYGDNGDDYIEGDDGNDTIYGGDGNDQIYGE